MKPQFFNLLLILIVLGACANSISIYKLDGCDVITASLDPQSSHEHGVRRDNKGVRFIKYLGALAVVAVFLLVIVINFSAVSSRFECSGDIAYRGESQSAIIYMELKKYRWWVGLWSDSYGTLHLEIPNQALLYYGHIKEVGLELHLYDRFTNPSWKDLKGNFSTLSKVLAIKTYLGFFDGKCRDTK